MPLVRRPLTLEELLPLSDGGQLFAVVDSCDSPGVPLLAFEIGPERAVSLLNDRAQQTMWAVAPYLFRADRDVLQWLWENVWGDAWGIFVVMRATLEQARASLQQLLVVAAPDGEQWLFRFYDPRVLPEFLESSDASQLREAFCTAELFAIPGSDRTGVELLQLQA